MLLRSYESLLGPYVNSVTTASLRNYSIQNQVHLRYKLYIPQFIYIWQKTSPNERTEERSKKLWFNKKVIKKEKMLQIRRGELGRSFICAKLIYDRDNV